MVKTFHSQFCKENQPESRPEIGIAKIVLWKDVVTIDLTEIATLTPWKDGVATVIGLVRMCQRGSAFGSEFQSEEADRSDLSVSVYMPVSAVSAVSAGESRMNALHEVAAVIAGSHRRIG